MKGVIMTDNDLTRAGLVSEAKSILSKMIKSVQKAPVKRGWSQLASMSIPSKRDCLAAAKADLQALNQVSAFFGWEPVYVDPEEEEVRIGTVKE